MSASLGLDRGLPRVSRRFVAVWRRNFLVWRKHVAERVLSNIVEPLITLVAFGYGLGSLLPAIDGVSYLQFLASGSIVSSVMYTAKFESLWGSYSRMEVQKTWAGVLNTPTAIDDVLLGELIWAASKATITGAAILAVIWGLDITRSASSLLVLPVAFLSAFCFAAMAMIVTALARGYETLSNYFVVVVTPMVFLSGVYFPLSQMPSWLQGIAHGLPLTAAVEIMRPLVLGRWPENLARDGLLLAAYGLVSYYIAVVLVRRRLLK